MNYLRIACVPRGFRYVFFVASSLQSHIFRVLFPVFLLLFSAFLVLSVVPLRR